MLIEGLDYVLTSGTSLNPHNRKYTLLREYSFFYRTVEVVIPKGYVWDGPSGLPLVAWSAKKWLEPALQHDYLYFLKGNLWDIQVSRQEADELFFTGLLNNKVNATFIWILRTFMRKAFQKVWISETGSVKFSTLGKILWPLFAFLGLVATSGITATITYLY